MTDLLARLEVQLGRLVDAAEQQPLRGLHWEPPDQGATSYAVDLPRVRVSEDAQDCRARGAAVAVLEAGTRPHRRWRHLELFREGVQPGWPTCSQWPAALRAGLHGEVQP